MEEGRESVVASVYEGGAGASGSASGGKDGNSASVSPSPTRSPSVSPPPPPPVASAAATSAAAAPPGGVGMGLIMVAGMAPHHPLGLGGLGRVAGVGMVAAPMLAVGNVAVGEDLAKKKRGRPRKYGPEVMHGGASLELSSPTSSIVHFSPASAGELSSEYSGAKRRRGRPRGSGRRQLLAALGEWFAYSAGGNFTPHIVTIAAGEDVATRILSFSHKGPRAICILSANGSISNVTLRQPGSSGGTLTYEGRFEIISLSGSFTITENGGIRSRTGGISVSLAGPDGRVVGGGVAGLLLAASPIQVVVGSFLPNVLKQHKQRPSLHSPPFPTIPTASGVLTPAARPLYPTNPGDECKTPSSTLHGHNSHGETLQINTSNRTIPNYSSFQPVSWHGLQSSAEQKPSPDINVCLTGE